MCSVIKDRVKDLQQQDEERYRLVVHVMVGQDCDQMVCLSSRCLWNADEDCLASATYRNNSLFAVGVVFWLSS